MLHTFIEAKDKASYEKYAEIYFGTNNKDAQLAKLLSEDNIANVFGLYVYIKAFYFFYLNETNKAGKEKLINQINRCKNYKNIDSHPWEMIFKYTAFLCVSIGNNEYKPKADEYIALAKQIANPEGILKSIIKEIDTQYASVCAGNIPFEKTDLLFMYR